MKKSRIIFRVIVLTLLVLSFSCTFVHAAIPTIFIDVPDKIFRNPICVSASVSGNLYNPVFYVDNNLVGTMSGSNSSYYYVWTPPYVSGSGSEHTVEVRAQGSNGGAISVKTVWVSAYTKDQRGIASASPYTIVERARSGQDCLGYALGVNSGMSRNFDTIGKCDELMRSYGYYRVEDRDLAKIIVYGEHPQSYSYNIKHFAIKTGVDSTRTKLGYDGEVVDLITRNPYNSMWGNEIAYYNYCPYLS